MNEQALVREVEATLRPSRDWTPEQRRVIAAIVVLQQCTFNEAAAALWTEMREADHNVWSSPHILGHWVKDAGYRIQSARRRSPVVVEQSHAVYGSPTNVISCEFNQRENRRENGGALKATVLGEACVRAEFSALRWRALHDIVDNQPVANENDPNLTEQPRWHTKVQGAWVARAAAKRASEARS